MEPEKATSTSEWESVPKPPRLLRRSRRHRVFSGVCGGLGQYLGLDPVWIRVGFVVFALASLGWGILVYFLLALAIPKEPFGYTAGSTTALDDSTSKLIGLALIALGGVFLFNMLIPLEWVFKFIGPLILIAVGAAIVLRRER